MIQVEQCDREASASAYFAWISGNPVIPAKMRAGEADDHSMVQAFARHRVAALGGRSTAAPLTHAYKPHRKYPWFCAECGYPEHERLKHTPSSHNESRTTDRGGVNG